MSRLSASGPHRSFLRRRLRPRENAATLLRGARACLALLAAAALLALAAPAQAQTEVWTATLTPADLSSGILGCSNNIATARCSSTTFLSEDSFNHDSTDYNITGLFVRSSGRFEFLVDADLTTATAALTLVVGSTSFVLADANIITVRKRVWFNTGVSLTAGTDITVKLTAPGTNTAPTAANNTVTTAEDRAYTFTAADFGFMDADAGAALASVKIVTPPGEGTLALDGTAVMADDIVTKDQIDGDMLTFTPARDAHGDPYTSFTFTVNDGTVDSANTYTMTIDVTDAPAPVCGVPDIAGDGRRQIWTSTVTVEALTSVGVTEGYGFVEPSMGELALKEFDIGSNNYTIGSIGVSTFGGRLIFALGATVVSLTATETAALRLHVCDGDYDFSTATSAVDNMVTFHWTTASLDWSPPVVTRTVYLSLPANNVATDEPTISGTAQVGQELTADASPIVDTDGLTGVDFTYQWLRVDADGTSNEEDISGEIAETYTLATDDAGKKIKVKVSFTDELSGEEMRTSAAYPSSGTVTTAGTNTAPMVTDVDVTSMPASGDTYGIGEMILFTVTFDQNVTVTGTPEFEFCLGSSSTMSCSAGMPPPALRSAAYESGSGTTALVFSYTVVAGDVDDNGIWIGNQADTLKLDAADTIEGTMGGLTAVLTHAEEGPQTGHKVDGGAPTVPPDPTPPTLVLATATTLTIEWTHPGDGGSPLTRNFIEYRVDGTTAWTNWYRGETPTSVTRTVIRNLAAATAYDVRVHSTNAIGNSQWVQSATAFSTLANNAATGEPSITGTATVGQELTATTGTIADDDGLPSSFTYQWVRVDADGTSNPVDITDATAATYTLTADDEGKKVKVKVSFTDDLDSTETRTSAAYPSIGTVTTNTAPTGADNTVTTGVGTAYAFTADDFGFADDDAGDTLASVKIVTVPDEGTLALAGTDVTLNDVVTKAQIDGEMLTFTPVAGASGTGYASFTFKVSDGTADSASAYTMTIDVTAAPGTNTAPAAANNTVTTAEDTAYTFEADDFRFMDADPGDTLAIVKIWSSQARGTLALDGVAIIWYAVVTKAQIDGKMLTFTPARDAHGDPYVSFSFRVNDGTDDSASGYTMRIDVTDAPAPVCGVPSFGDRRNIWTGTVTVGTYRFGGSPLDFYGYKSSAPPSGDLDDQTFTIGSNDYTIVLARVALGGSNSGELLFEMETGQKLTTVEVAALRLHVCDTTVYNFSDATNSRLNSYGWSGSLDWSHPVVTRTVYLSLPANNAATGEPAITGTATVGQELTAGVSGIDDDDGLPSVLDYQWFRVDADGTSNEEEISGETADTYTLTADDVGKRIKVKVSFTDELSGVEMRTSAAYPSSGTVTAAAGTPTGAPTITGTAQVGETLTAVTTGIADADGLTSPTYTYQWIRVNGTDADISGANSSTYPLVTADLGKTIKVRVTFVDDDGNTEMLTSASSGTVTTEVTPPSLSSATVQGMVLTLVYDEPLDPASTPPPSAYILTVKATVGTTTTNTETNPAAVSVSGSRVRLTLDTAPAAGVVTVTLIYVGSVVNPVQDVAGNDALPFGVHVMRGNPPPPTNTAPVVANPLADQEVTVDVPFTYVVPADAFTDADGDLLTYTAALSGGGMLPSWLTFDPATRTFTGTPTAADVGTVSVKVTASDGSDSVSDTFDIVVSPPADTTAPRVASIVRGTSSSSPTNADSLTWRVTFSEAVSNVDTADFAVSGTTATLSVSAVSGVTGAYDVTASGGNLAGVTATVTLSIATGHNIQDAASNALTNTTPTGANDKSYVVDNTAPTVTITGVPGTSSAAFTATFTFTEAVTGFVVGEITLGNATASNFTVTSTTIYTALITPTANGAVTVDVAADVATDAVGNGNTAATQVSSTYTMPVPTITIAAGTTPVTEGASAAFTLTRSGGPPGNPELTVNVSVTETQDMVAAADKGAKTVIFQANSATAMLGVATVADSVDETDSVVTATVTANPATYTVGTSSSATVTVTDDDTRGVTVSAETLAVNEDSSGTYTVKLDSEPTASVTVTPSSGNSDVTVSSALTFTTMNWSTAQTVTVTAAHDSDAVDDSATISHAVSGGDYGAVTAASVTVTVDDDETADTTAPQVASIARQTPASSPTNADSLTWRVTFSEAVSNVDTADFAVSGTTATPSVSAVSGVTGAYDVTASGGDLAGVTATVTLSIATGHNIQDAASNALTNTTPTGANDNSYVVDNTAPTVTITGVPGTSSAAFTATFTFTEAVTGFVVDEITLGNATASSFMVTSTTVYTALITPTANGAVTVDVAADVALDAAGNGNTAATQASSTYTMPVPTITIAAGTTPVTEGASAAFTLTRSGGPPGNPELTVNVSVTETQDMVAAADKGAKTVIFQANSATAMLGVATVADSVDETDSVVTATVTVTANPATYTVGTSSSATVTVTDDDTRGVTVSAPTLAVNEGSSGTYTVVLDSEPTASVTVTPSSGNSDVTVSSALTFTTMNWSTAQMVTVTAAQDSDAVDDSATISHAVEGGDYGAVTAASVTVTVDDDETADTTAPTVTSIVRQTPTSSPTNADSLTWRVTFSEAVSNVDTADFAVSGTTATLSVSAVSGVTGAYDVTASGGNLAGVTAMVTLSIAAGHTIQDAASTALTNTTPTGANDKSYVVDNTAPTVTITGVPGTSSAAFTATFTFTEAVTGFVVGEITLGNATASSFMVTSTTIYTALITPTANGAVTVDVAADVALDAAGNGNTAATQASSTYTASSANTAPTAANNTVTTAEDRAYTFTAADFGFMDADTGAALASVKIVTVPAAGILALDGTAVTTDGVVTKAQIDGDMLTFRPARDAHGDPYTTFTFTVNDGTDDSASAYTMTIDVTPPPPPPPPPNTPPAAADNTVTTGEDTAYAFTADDFGFADTDTGDTLASVKIVTVPTPGTLALDGPDVTLNQVVTTAQIDGGMLTFTPVAGASGTGYASFTFKVSDGTDDSASAYTMTIDVTAAPNTAPTAVHNTVTTAEDTAYAFTADDFGFADMDAGDTLASVKIVTVPDEGTLALDGTAVVLNDVVTKAQIDGDMLTFTPVAGASGDPYTTFTFKVNDGTDDSASAYTMTIDVTAAPNTAPTAVHNTVTTGVGTAYTFTAADFGFMDADAGDTLASVTIVTPPAPGTLALAGTAVALNDVVTKAQIDDGDLIFTPVAGASGTGYASFTFKVNDGTDDSASAYTMTIDVTPPPPNTAPVVAIPLADQEVTVDVPFTYVIPADAFTDADGNPNPLTYAAALSDGGMLPSWLVFDPATRTFTGTPGPGDSGPVRVTVMVSDGTATVSDEFALRVHMVAPSTLQAWTSRFGRTVATHVTDAVGERLRPSPEQDSQVTVGGYRLPLGKPATGRADRKTTADPETATAPKTATDRLASLLTGLVGRALGLGPAQPQGGGPGTDLWAAPPAADPRLGQSQTLHLPTVRLRDVLLGSSFRLTLGDDDAAPGHLRLTAWGRVAGTQFNGRDGAVTLDGNVLTGTVGVDSEWDRLLAGLAVSHSLGGGSFSLTGAGGDDNLDNSTLTSIHPYLRYAVNERVDVWSVLGYGWGDMTLEPGTGGTLETDTTLLMGSFGGRGILLSAPDNAGFQLATRADAMLTRMTSDAVAGFAETEADAHRLRLVLEGTRPVLWPEGQSVTPTVELGVRHDWGDAETGFGLELGGRVQYADPTLGLTIEAAVRGLLTHEDSDYKEWGASGTIRIAPDPNGQGLSLTLAPTWGAASSGIESLWSRQTTAGLAPQGTRPRPTTSLNAEMGYGVAAPFGTGLLTPYAGALLSDGTAHSYRLGTRWTSASGLTLNVEGTRQDQAGQQPPTQGLQFQVTWGF